MGAEGRTDARIAALAAGAHGVVTRERLMSQGIGPRQIARRVEKGSLIRVHRGVYRVGHAAPSMLARYAAAVLACGDGALLAATAAGHLHRLLKQPPPTPIVLTPTERAVPGVVTRRYRKQLTEEEVTITRAIPVTSVPRTLADLAGLVDPAELARAFHRAKILHGTHPATVETILALHPKTPGIAALRRVLRGEQPVELSRLETAFRRLLREQGLPLPVMNRPEGGHLLDCRWPEHRVTVELDSFTFHNSLHAWDGDRARERAAYARGDAFRRFTRIDVFDEQTVMLRVLHDLLS
ncbi:MAG: type IV toxin-antitoxin system AbiEi family antitoxin domain-containing protein [Solirubrobacteraceae bacterium]